MPRFRIVAHALLLLALTCTGCLVLDTIEFEDEINYPFLILYTDPQYGLESVCAGKTQPFSVTVWDPNETSASHSDIEARLFFFPNTNPNTSGTLISNCTTTQHSSFSDNFETGATVTLECGGKVIDEDQIDTLVKFELRVSDLGWANNETAKQGANTAEVLWFLRVENCN
ncbi:MAG: hypothetical protein GY847_17690 [Proteobacteria bacterium]|nr:hypothetical protein [Pseudomonadota bacterium]